MPRFLPSIVCTCLLLLPIWSDAAELRLRGLLSGRNVVSAVDTNATGEVRGVLDDDNHLRIDLVYSDLEETATGAELHLGKAIENGALLQKLDLDLDIDDHDGRIVGAMVDLNADAAERIRAGEGYLLIRTHAHPNGALRGQLAALPTRLPEAVPESPITVPAG